MSKMSNNLYGLFAQGISRLIACFRGHIEEDQVNIIDLNDDCLLDILGQLSTNDLNSTASTCPDLLVIARMIFQKNPAHTELVICKEMIHNWNHLISYLQNFGDLIRKIHFKPEFSNLWPPPVKHAKAEQNATIYNVIRRHCGPTLEILHLDGVRMPRSSVAGNVDSENNRREQSPHFPNLKEFRLIECFEALPNTNDKSSLARRGGSYIHRLLKGCSSNFLEHLPSADTLNNLSVIDCIFNEDLCEILGRYRKLRKLELCGCSGDSHYNHLGTLNQINELVLAAPRNLEEKTWLDKTEFLLHLGSTQSLKRLEVRHFNISDKYFYHALRRFFNLFDLHFDRVYRFHAVHFHLFDGFPNLMKFTYNGHGAQEFISDDIIGMVRNMPKLGYLRIFNDDSPSDAADHDANGDGEKVSIMTNKLYRQLVTICKQQERKLIFCYEGFYDHYLSSSLLHDNENYVKFVDRF